MHHIESLRADYDVIVVGARCAGAATALNLARGGARVLVLDRDHSGADTLSTHAILRVGVTLLDRWGLLPALEAAGTPVVRRTTFDYGDEVVSVDVRPEGGAAGLYAPRRYLLDHALAEAAGRAGATISYGVRCVGLVRDDTGRVSGVETLDAAGVRRTLGARMVVGADGRASSVAALVGAETYRAGRCRTATIYGYFPAPPRDSYNWVFRPGVGAGFIPTNDERVCIFASVAPDRYRETFGTDPLRGMRALLALTGGGPADLVVAEPDGPLRRFAGAPGHFRQSVGPGWALVGDAGYFKDPATAHGITDALRDASILAEAILKGDDIAIAGYQETRDALSREFFEITDRIASLEWTMDELRELHLRLHAATRAEQALVAAPQWSMAA